MFRTVLVSITALLLVLSWISNSVYAIEPRADDKTDRTAQEKQLEKRLSHGKMVGFYTASDQDGPPKLDEYTLGEVHKGEGDKWVFNATMKMGTKVFNIPLEIPVFWAGDTPVITVTDFSIPGMGTFTARVMITGDQYVGTWSSPKHGGFMWGKIEHAAETQPTGAKEGEKSTR